MENVAFALKSTTMVANKGVLQANTFPTAKQQNVCRTMSTVVVGLPPPPHLPPLSRIMSSQTSPGETKSL